MFAVVFVELFAVNVATFVPFFCIVSVPLLMVGICDFNANVPALLGN